MQVEKELCFKFPVVLRDKLLNKEIEFPDTTQFEYEQLFTYRAVERREDITKDPHYYGVSSFLKREIVELNMKFPNPQKKLAAGYVYSAGGPQDTKDQHVCWWLYEGADVSGFKIIEEKNNE